MINCACLAEMDFCELKFWEVIETCRTVAGILMVTEYQHLTRLFGLPLFVS